MLFKIVNFVYLSLFIIFSNQAKKRAKFTQVEHNDLRRLFFCLTHREVRYMDGDLQDAIQDAQYFGALCDPVPRYLALILYFLDPPQN